MTEQEKLFRKTYNLALSRLPREVVKYILSGKVLVLFPGEEDAAFHIRCTNFDSIIVLRRVLLRHPIQRQLEKIWHEISHAYSWHIGLVNENSSTAKKEVAADHLIKSWRK